MKTNKTNLWPQVSGQGKYFILSTKKALIRKTNKGNSIAAILSENNQEDKYGDF